jgi:cysteine desulfurase
MNYTYLDWAATAPPDRDALEYGLETAVNLYGNPSSLHSPGKEAANLLARCRKRLAELLGCGPQQLIFTSGGSESNSLVFSRLLTNPGKQGMLVSAIEHPSVWESARAFERLGYPLTVLRCENDGRVDPLAALEQLGPETGLISLMLVNNETGSIQDPAALAEAVRNARRGRKMPHLHTDAVQALGKIPLDLSELGVDSASFSGHKIGAPRGIGLLYLRRPAEPFFRGGRQEGGMRPGTENLPAIAALTRVMEKRIAELDVNLKRAKDLKAVLVEGLRKSPGALILPEGGDPLNEAHSPYILKCAFTPIPGEILQRVLNDRGFAVSTGSACSSSRGKTNRVLKAMGTRVERAESSIRISWGPSTTKDEIEAFLATVKDETRILKEQL